MTSFIPQGVCTEEIQFDVEERCCKKRKIHRWMSGQSPGYQHLNRRNAGK